jgi:hypothetical protein
VSCIYTKTKGRKPAIVKQILESYAYLLGLVEVVPTVKGEEGAVLVITERKDMQCTLLVEKQNCKS